MTKTCPDCGRTLRFMGQYTYSNGDTVYAYECWCGYEIEIPVEKTKDKTK